MREVLADGQKYRQELLPLVQSNRLRSISDLLKDLEMAYGSGASAGPLSADQKRQRRRK